MMITAIETAAAARAVEVAEQRPNAARDDRAGCADRADRAPKLPAVRVRRRQSSSVNDSRRRLLPRLQVEELVHISRYFSPADRALVHAVYERGLPLKAIALLHNVKGYRLRRRLERIAMRVRSPLFRTVLREHHTWPADRRALAEAAVLRGEPMRVVAREFGLSLHEVRKELERLRGLSERAFASSAS